MHLMLGAALTWLLALAAVAGIKRPRAGAAITVLAMCASAPLLEYVQRRTGRGSEVGDVAAHMTGVLVALGVWAAVCVGRTVVYAASSAPAEPAEDNPETPLNSDNVADDADAAPPSSEAQTRATRFVGHAVHVGALTLISRLTGLVRDAVLAAAFGLGVVADAFFIGFLVPNLFRRLFGEGALASSFIPHYTELLRKDPLLAKRFAALCLVMLALVLAAITVVGEVLLGSLLGGQWSEGTGLALRLTMVMLPYMPLVCVVALVGGMLQVHGRFGAPAAAPILLNVTIITAAALAAFGPRPSASLHTVAYWVALAVLIAGALQVASLLVALRRVVTDWPGLSGGFHGAWPTLRSMLLMMGPMAAALAVFQVNALLDSLIAFFFSPRDGATTLHLLGFNVAPPVQTGSVAALQWAQRLYQFPLGVFGIALATAIFPALSHAAGRSKLQQQDETFGRVGRQGLRLTVFIGLPATVGLMLVRTPLTQVIYQRAAFSAADTQRVAAIVLGYAASIWAYSLTHVLTRAFYAVKDAATPLRVSLFVVAANFVLNLCLIWPLGAAGLAWSSATTGAAQALALLVLVRRLVGAPVTRAVAIGWGRTGVLTGVMAIAVWLVVTATAAWRATGWGAAGALALAVTVGAAVMLGGAWASGAPELRWMLRRRMDG